MEIHPYLNMRHPPVLQKVKENANDKLLHQYVRDQSQNTPKLMSEQSAKYTVSAFEDTRISCKHV